MRKFRTAAALALCAVCLLQTAAPVLAAEDYPAPDVSGKTVEELIDAFRAEHDLTEDNFELSYYNTVTGESYDFNETKMLYLLPLAAHRRLAGIQAGHAEIFHHDG